MKKDQSLVKYLMSRPYTVPVILMFLVSLIIGISMYIAYKNNPPKEHEMTVTNDNMKPTYEEGDVVKYYESSEFIGVRVPKIERGKTVVYKSSEHNQNNSFALGKVTKVKQDLELGLVRAVPKDIITITSNVIYVNKEEIKLTSVTSKFEGVLEVPEGCYIVLPETNVSVDMLLRGEDTYELNCTGDYNIYPLVEHTEDNTEEVLIEL